MSVNQEEIHLRDYLRVINKRRNLVAVFFLVTVVIVAVATFAMTPQYRGESQVMIEKQSTGTLIDPYRSSYDPEFYETQFQLIKSQRVARRVVQRLQLDAPNSVYLQTREEAGQGLTGWIGGLKETLKGLIRSTDEEEGEGVSLADRIAAELSDAIVVTPVKNSRIVAVSYDHPDPVFAARIANNVTDAYLEENLEMKMESTQRNLEWMTRKAEEERLKLEAKEQELQQYMRENDLVTLEDRITVIPQKLSEISTQLVKAESRRKEMESLYHKVRAVAGNEEEAESVLTLTSGTTLQTLRDQILKAEQQIRELSSKYGPKHPTMIKAQGDLEILRAKKSEEIERLINSVRNEYELAAGNENNLRAQLERTRAEAQRLNEKFVQYNVLKREMEANRQLYDALLLKMKEQSITGESEPINLWIVEKAQVPQAPVKPRKAVNLLLGLIVGLFGGVGLAFFVEYLDNTVKYPEETERALGLPVLGLISYFKQQKEKGEAIEQVLIKEPRSTFAESYRALRTAVLLSHADREPKRVMITSPGMAAGKTTTAVNLAIALAQMHKKVLLIDADMRKPRLHKIFEKGNQNGLSNYLAGGSGESLLKPGPVENLALITSGPIPPNPSELLSSARMESLLGKMEEKFDIVICDTPPLMSVADARILSHLFEGTILVVRARQTTFDLAGKALKSLRDINSPVLGLVINALEMKKNDYYYQYYYSAYGEEPAPETAKS